VITEKAWHNRANWGNDEWDAWETWCWYRQFCRAVSGLPFIHFCGLFGTELFILQYAPYLRNYIATLSVLSFARFEGTNDPAGGLLKEIFTTAVEL
jgi:nuclear cap-binding protein subunit 1